MKKLLVTTALGAAALAYCTAANAATTISLEVLDGANAIIGSVSGVGGGTATVGGTAAAFTFSVTAFGVPTVASPDFATVTIDADVGWCRWHADYLGNPTGPNGLPKWNLGRPRSRPTS